MGRDWSKEGPLRPRDQVLRVAGGRSFRDREWAKGVVSVSAALRSEPIASRLWRTLLMRRSLRGVSPGRKMHRAGDTRNFWEGFREDSLGAGPNPLIGIDSFFFDRPRFRYRDAVPKRDAFACRPTWSRPYAASQTAEIQTKIGNEKWRGQPRSVDRRRPAGAPTIIVVESGSRVFRRRVSNIVVHRSCSAAPSRQLQDRGLTITSRSWPSPHRRDWSMCGKTKSKSEKIFGAGRIGTCAATSESGEVHESPVGPQK